MAENEKRPDAPRAYFPRKNYSPQNNVSYHFSAYGGSETFRSMKKKAEQAMTDHEFKA